MKLQMKLLKLRRTFNEGFTNFRRNGWLSFATVIILSISLYIISFTAILAVATSIILTNIQDKINISVYFKQDVGEERILEIKDKLIGFQEIKSIEYVSKEQALEQFRKFGDNSPSISQALDEIGDNPLLAALVIKAESPDQYDLISKSIAESSYSEEIDKIDFYENKEAIERLNSIMGLIKKIGLALGAIFVFIGILITFNAIRLTMYAQRQEFEIMRLVGASNRYIRAPFIFEGIFYGIFSAVVVMVGLYFTSMFLAPLTEESISGGNLATFYLKNSLIIFGSLIFSGILLGTVSAMIAIRKYLKI
jgi:cell division transport system permease protein